MNEKKGGRRSFLRNVALSSFAAGPAGGLFRQAEKPSPRKKETGQGSSEGEHVYNGKYSGEYLDKIAFPLGGIGAGMVCMEGRGAISHVSVRNHPQIYHEPNIFAALCVKGRKNGAKVLEGPVPGWRIFGLPDSGIGDGGKNYGLPRFDRGSFTARFPFCTVELADDDIPFEVRITGWSPFIPTNEDDSSLPVGALEYVFEHRGNTPEEAVFSFNAENFMNTKPALFTPPNKQGHIDKMQNGFILSRTAPEEEKWESGSFALFTDDDNTVVDYCWFRGGNVDPITMTWETIEKGVLTQREPIAGEAPGASLFVPFRLRPGEKKKIRLMMAWYVPDSNLRIGEEARPEDLKGKLDCTPASGCCTSLHELNNLSPDDNGSPTFKPWYSGKFKRIQEVCDYWKGNYRLLRDHTELFKTAFYSSTLPDEVLEAVAANLTILKSPTVLRQADGRFWAFEGCMDNNGCCHGSCTHVWNYAQSLPHLFPALERSLRETEFCENQRFDGRQEFRAILPIRPVRFNFDAAADGQLGGIMKVYREWRISGDSEWMRKLFPMVRKSMDYCMETWDPQHSGVLRGPQHNTYDLDFWGPNGMCTSFYLGALTAMIRMGDHLGEETSFYRKLYAAGRSYLEEQLFNGEYFFQKVEYKNSGISPIEHAAQKFYLGKYSPEAIALFEKEGPKYQYGNGCLSDGILGAWIAAMCGLDDPVDGEKIKSHLVSVHKYNLKRAVGEYANPNRPGFAFHHEGGVLLCTWPEGKGEKPSLPFHYSSEVWTGIEYQVASHLMIKGEVKAGLEIVRACRDRYRGNIRNPFNEYECGHWYARAMSSYGMIQGLTGVRFDAVDRILYIDSRIGDFTGFLSTDTGFGNVGLKKGKPFLKVRYGKIVPDKTMVAGKESELAVI